MLPSIDRSPCDDVLCMCTGMIAVVSDGIASADVAGEIAEL